MTTSPSLPTPVFDYSSRDYASVYQDLLNRIPLYLPEWTSQSDSDFGIVLLQMFAYTVDLLSYYIDRVAAEAFLQTATQASSILNIASMLDYTPALSAGAQVELQIAIGSNVVGPYTIPAGSQFSTPVSSSVGAVVFETTTDLVIAGANGATPALTGSVIATQGITYYDENVAVSTGVVNQVYPLAYSPISSASIEVSVDLGQGPGLWSFEQSLISAGPYDQVYTVYVDANQVAYVVFGDGVNGLVPPLGSPITCTYSVNQGSVGNVGANTITQVVSSLVGVDSVVNAAPATGGSDAESLASIRERAPLGLKALNRGVTLSDLETLATQVAGVQWASAVAETYQLITLYAAPAGGGLPSAGLLSSVEGALTPTLLVGSTLTVLAPTYIPLNISASVVAYAAYGNTAVQQQVESALQNLLAAANTGFGLRVTLGNVYTAILQVPGVNYAQVTLLERSIAAFLASALTSGVQYSSLAVSPLSEPISATTPEGSTASVTINPGGASSQTVALASGVLAGSSVIPVALFTATADYPEGTPIYAPSGLAQDCVLLSNEIPVAGTISITVTGGLPNS